MARNDPNDLWRKGVLWSGGFRWRNGFLGMKKKCLGVAIRNGELGTVRSSIVCSQIQGTIRDL